MSDRSKCGCWPVSGRLNDSECRYPLDQQDMDYLRGRLEAVERERDVLRRQLTVAQANNHQRNIELDALHYVWCDGGCKGGVHRFGEHPKLTAEIVAAAETNARRLRSWYVNRAGNAAPPTVEDRIPAWLKAYREVFDAQLTTAESELRAAREERDELRRWVLENCEPHDDLTDHRPFVCGGCFESAKNEQSLKHETNCIWIKVKAALTPGGTNGTE